MHAESIVFLEPIDGEFDEDWYKMSDVNAQFSASIVRPAVHSHRVKTGQHVPIAPLVLAPRR